MLGLKIGDWKLGRLLQMVLVDCQGGLRGAASGRPKTSPRNIIMGVYRVIWGLGFRVQGYVGLYGVSQNKGYLFLGRPHN